MHKILENCICFHIILKYECKISDDFNKLHFIINIKNRIMEFMWHKNDKEMVERGFNDFFFQILSYYNQ